MNYLFIRHYKKDDYLARLCYESWVLAGYKGEVIFFSEDCETEWCKGIGKFHQRKAVGNFGGQLGATGLIEGLKEFKFEDYDIIVTCDTDIIIKQNPLPEFVEDFGGTGGINEHGWAHISGQLMIYKGQTLNQILSDSPGVIQGRWMYMDSQGFSICDDSFMSYSVHLLKDRRVQLFTDMWVHDKMYHLEPRTDWAQIVKEI